ncbi:MAG: terpene cyclase/mutase family protein [Kiritimatiellaeota bacterium]|nr:terpene cyclase/mutase family protein [Kiritimatiellota bacterium]
MNGNTSGHDRAYQEMLRLFEEASFGQRMKRMLSGLGQPKESGEYKFAKLQLQRLSAPFLAVTVPLALLVALLAIGPTITAGDGEFEVEVIRPEVLDDLEDPELPPPMDATETFDSEFAYDDFTEAVTISDPTPTPTVTTTPTVQQIKSPIAVLGMMAGPMAGRSATARTRAIKDGGGDEKTEDAVMRALRWYVTKQNPNGSWGTSERSAMTGFALLCFLAHGELPGQSDEFGETVQRGLMFLTDNVLPNGFFAEGRHDYAHAIATYALCEAYAMTRMPTLKEAAEKTLVPIIQGQHPNGGWDYGLAQTDRDDTSVMGWCAQAIKAGHTAGMDVPGLNEAYKNIAKGMKGNYGVSTIASKPMGGFGYTGPSPGGGGLTGVGVLALQLTGNAKDAAVRAGLNTIDSWNVGWEGNNFGEEAGSGQYYFYYATQCMFHEGGARWTRWNNRMKPSYTKAQTIIPATESEYVDHTGTPQAIGYWECEDSAAALHVATDGIFDTALMTLQLEVYYRFLPGTYGEFAVIDSEIILEEAPGDEIGIIIKM